MNIPRILIAGLRGGGGTPRGAGGIRGGGRRGGGGAAPSTPGPDFIDTAWSAASAGRPCRNLDLFLSSPERLAASFASACAGAEVAVIEGNRGLFDGVDAQGSCSTAELAKLLRCPVILVADCAMATRTVAAMVLGCRALDPSVPLRGVILNRLAGARHEAVVRAAVEEATGLPVVGAIPRLPTDILPERHMGLVPPPERVGREEAIREAGEAASRFLDLAAIEALAWTAPPFDPPVPASRNPGTAGPGRVRIGVFRDAAFQFYYPENLDALVREGATLVEISPLADRCLPEVDAVYAGGGFPETHAAGLADNAPFRDSVRRAAEGGMPVYAECGGAVFLGETLDYGGREYPMAGVLPVAFGFQERPRGHGYSLLETVAENPFFAVGEKLRGHEFHHSFPRSASRGNLAFAFRVDRGTGFDGRSDGLLVRNVLACYTHLHALSAEGWAPAVVAAARRFRAGAASGAAMAAADPVLAGRAGR